MSHLTSLTLALSIYLFLAVSCYGWGRLAALAAGVSDRRPGSPLFSVWLGWAVSLFVLQSLHFLVPVNAWVALPVYAVGAFFSLPHLTQRLRRLAQDRSGLALTAVSAILALLAAAWLASRAMLPPTNYDTGLYHLNAIRWINTYPVVPGLGNLHGRLAFNQSFFTFAAALSLPAVFEHGRSLANSFLLLMLAATVWGAVLTLLRIPSRAVEQHPFRYLPDLFLVPVLAFLALSSNGVASPTPDLTSFILQCVMFLLLAHGIAEWKQGEKDQTYRTVILVVLAATAVTVKLSNLAFSAVILLFALAYLGSRWAADRHLDRKQGPSLFLSVLAPAVLPLLVWAGQGILLSGAPLYPSTAGYFSWEWSVPVEKIVREANSVYSWARLPGAQPKDVLGSWVWFGPWFARVSRGNLLDLSYPVLLAALFSVGSWILARIRRVKAPDPLEWAFLLPALAGLSFWFFTAPDPRFANAVFFLLSIGSSLIFLSSLKDLVEPRLYVQMCLLVFVVANALLLKFVIDNAGELRLISTSGWQPVSKVHMQKRVTDGGLTVYVPEKGDQCWDSDLPSTPVFNDRLRLRKPNSIASGFTVM